jgi:hypothetical protein
MFYVCRGCTVQLRRAGGGVAVNSTWVA